MEETSRQQCPFVRDGDGGARYCALAEDRVRELETALKDALSAWATVDWMARNYAEAGGSSGPEMRDYLEAEALIQKARPVLLAATDKSEVTRCEP